MFWQATALGIICFVGGACVGALWLSLWWARQMRNKDVAMGIVRGACSVAEVDVTEHCPLCHRSSSDAVEAEVS